MKTYQELIENIKKYPEVEKLLDTAPSASYKGFLYQSIWDVVIKSNSVDIFYGCTHLTGNANIGTLEEVHDLERYIKDRNIVSGSKDGVSDITMRRSNKLLYCSCKYLSKENIDNYDVEKIATLATSKIKSQDIESYEIYILTKSKTVTNEVIERARDSSNHIKNLCKKENTLGVDELQKYYTIFRELLRKEGIKYFSIPKPSLVLKFHQRLIVERTLKFPDRKNILWGCKPRSGKTYMACALILYSKSKNTLIITAAPSESIPEFNKLLQKYKEFHEYNVSVIKSSKELENIRREGKNIYLASKQLLQAQKTSKLSAIDLIIWDESHYASCTEISSDILKMYRAPSTLVLFLTATYNKPLLFWGIDDRIYWDMEDENQCKIANKIAKVPCTEHDECDGYCNKNKGIVALGQKYGGVFTLIKKLRSENKNIKELFHEYEKYPKIYYLTNRFKPEIFESIKEKIKDTTYGMCMSTLFSLTKKKNAFNFPWELKRVLSYISGSNKEEDFPERDYSILKRMEAQSAGRKILTQIWFLPPNNIQETSFLLKKLIGEDLVLRDYEVFTVNSKEGIKDIKLEIAIREEKVVRTNKRGLIILAGNMLTLGITLPRCDAVFLLNDSTSADKVIQMSYRCMSESEKYDKPWGFVVDFDAGRTVNTLLTYQSYKDYEDFEEDRQAIDPEEKLRQQYEYGLMNIDNDYYEANKIDINSKLEWMLDLWRTTPINRIKNLMRELEQEIIELNSEDQKSLDTYITPHIEKTTTAEVEISGQEQLAKGKNKIQNDEQALEIKPSKEIDKISLTRDLLAFVLPLAHIITVKNSARTFPKVLELIAHDRALLDVFNEQCFIWWGKSEFTDFIGFVSDLYKKYVTSSRIEDISLSIKFNLQQLIDRPIELLEMINSVLKPKSKEKKLYGEVFTPISLIEEMFDKLDFYYRRAGAQHDTQNTGKSIFSDPSLKWFDPASGMGNFLIVLYLRLMTGLKDVIPEEKTRKKHILEKMIYMSELNSKNVFVCKEIFDVNNEYNLNLYNGDTLQLNTEEEWGVDKFDVIVGNPPYNKGGIKSCSGKQLGDKNETIWPVFVKRSLNWLKPRGFLVFITPLSWLKITHSIHREVLEKHLLWLKLWDDSKSKSIINACIPLSIYVLKNILNTDKSTDIISEIKGRNLITTSVEYLDPKHSIPLAYHSIFNKLTRFIQAHNCALEYKNKTVKASGSRIKLPVNYTAEDNWAVDTCTLKEGVLVKKANEDHPDSKKLKLIIANKRGFKNTLIDVGNLSLTGSDKFYILGDNLELVKKILNFSISKIIVQYTKYRMSFLDKEAFKYIPDLRKLKITDITEDEFYKLIRFTEQEIAHIST